MGDIQAVIAQLDFRFALRPGHGNKKPILFRVTRTLDHGVRSTMEMDLAYEALGQRRDLSACVIAFYDLGDHTDDLVIDQIEPLIFDAIASLEQQNPRGLWSLDSPRVLSSTEFRDIARQWLYDKEMDEDGVSRLRFWRDRWWLWSDGAYVRTSEHQVRHMIYSWVSGMMFYNPKGQLEIYNATKSKVVNIVDPLRYLPEVFLGDTIQMPQWIETPTKAVRAMEDMICFEDCMMDCGSIFRGRPGRFAPTPRLFSAWKLPYEYDARAECPWFLRALETCLPDEASRNLLQEWFGFQLVPDVRQEKMMMMIGKPGAGKGTILSGMEAMLGDANIASTSFSKLGGQFGLAGLMGKLCAIDGDAQITQRTDSAAALEMVKRISSGDLVPVEPKGVDAETTRLICRFTFAVNELPALPDQSAALRRRLLILHFPNTFTDKPDIGLKERIKAEGQGICTWALAGLRRLRERGRFAMPAVSVRIVDNYAASMSPVASFVTERCNIGGLLWIGKGEMYDAWETYRQGEHLPKINRSTFGARLINFVPSVVAQRQKYIGVDLKHEFRRL